MSVYCFRGGYCILFRSSGTTDLRYHYSHFCMFPLPRSSYELTEEKKNSTPQSKQSVHSVRIGICQAFLTRKTSNRRELWNILNGIVTVHTAWIQSFRSLFRLNSGAWSTLLLYVSPTPYTYTTCALRIALRVRWAHTSHLILISFLD